MNSAMVIFALITLFGLSDKGSAHAKDIEKRFIRTFVGCDLPQPMRSDEIRPKFEATSRERKLIFKVSVDEQIAENVELMFDMKIVRKGRPVVFVVHGFLNGINEEYMQEIRDSILKIEDYTVIQVGWSKGSKIQHLVSMARSLFNAYNQAASNTRTVAQIIAKISNAILDKVFEGDRTEFYLYCIGFSLGAHICGEAGLFAPNLFDRITGLDPAGPSFDHCDNPLALQKTSAACVDVIHTHGFNKKGIHFGTLTPLGHVDFYPHKGYKNPKCWFSFTPCNHQAAPFLFIETLNGGTRTATCPAYGPCGVEPEDLPDIKCFKNRRPSERLGYFSSCHRDANRTELKEGVYFLPYVGDKTHCEHLDRDPEMYL